MNTIEHPDITRMRRYGDLRNDPEFFGFDYFGDEIFFGEEVVEIDGDLVLQDNLQLYLEEVCGAKFYTA
ncbi:hypothetical protein QQ991_03105 [Weizmannia coagulans]|uniref:Uncharacterized protein n=2 Tax=Heyndrickxia TaxID=2837504 RepID=A0A0C5C8X7_HEYCO|nr:MULTISPECIES: hypothetical protein [Heyndrickxia]AJO24813.1 hypothetical protein SB48_HM08orf06349 [Heyndrickxia coagulans]AKN53748.1 hypothetical protein AB434_1343 [Heyndrickxia coagulans]ATW84535.1 hypothetical protein CIW84_17020 [Heyndrickxia coagulans]KYC72320.1 hypothetical protein B4099_3682 [Heyndrickxia coagulans]MCR4445426.1 hypothetical protein [Heyndrickxia coagulans]